MKGVRKEPLSGPLGVSDVDHLIMPGLLPDVVHVRGNIMHREVVEGKVPILFVLHGVLEVLIGLVSAPVISEPYVIPLTC